jgi:hypothetical protein
VQVVRLHDPSRRPASWTDIIRPGQFAVFAKDDATGAPRAADGARLAHPAEASCAIFDSIDDARAFCEAGVARDPALRYDVFDADGRARPPLLSVLHPDRAASLETSPQQMRKRQLIAWALIVPAVPALAYAAFDFGQRIMPAFLGVNMLLIGGRLLWLNLALRETERAREQRLRDAGRDATR